MLFLLFGLWMLFDGALGLRWPAVAITDRSRWPRGRTAGVVEPSCAGAAQRGGSQRAAGTVGNELTDPGSQFRSTGRGADASSVRDPSRRQNQQTSGSA